MRVIEPAVHVTVVGTKDDALGRPLPDIRKARLDLQAEQPAGGAAVLDQFDVSVDAVIPSGWRRKIHPILSNCSCASVKPAAPVAAESGTFTSAFSPRPAQPVAVKVRALRPPVGQGERRRVADQPSTSRRHLDGLPAICSRDWV